MLAGAFSLRKNRQPINQMIQENHTASSGPRAIFLHFGCLKCGTSDIPKVKSSYVVNVSYCSNTETFQTFQTKLVQKVKACLFNTHSASGTDVVKADVSLDGC